MFSTAVALTRMFIYNIPSSVVPLTIFSDDSLVTCTAAVMWFSLTCTCIGVRSPNYPACSGGVKQLVLSRVQRPASVIKKIEISCYRAN